MIAAKTFLSHNLWQHSASGSSGPVHGGLDGFEQSAKRLPDKSNELDENNNFYVIKYLVDLETQVLSPC